jgi:pyruvate formate lyase activating enzyme
MIQIGGLQKLTLIDFPGRIASTVFVIGCNFKCPWCYSSELVLPEKIKKQPKISEKEIFNHLKERKRLLEGVVMCGGEPTINKKLPSFIEKIKKLGYLVKLDTNGSNPKMLKKLIKRKLIDYVAMDMKLPKERYPEIFGKRVKIEDIEESIKILKEGKVDYEFRTTVVPTVLNKEDILKIAKWIRGAKRYYLQNFRPEKTIDPEFEKIKPYPQEYLLEIQKAISPFFEVCQVR